MTPGFTLDQLSAALDDQSMQTVISLILWIVLFAIAAYGLYWVCTKFGLPQPVFWLCGALLLIIILLFMAHEIGAPLSFPNVPPPR